MLCFIIFEINYFIGGKNHMLQPSICLSCGGTGFREFTNDWGQLERSYCVDCNGTGYFRDPYSPISPKSIPRCLSCGGKGFHEFRNDLGYIERKYCVDCKGTGSLSGWGLL